MKRALLFVLLVVAVLLPGVHAQKYACINTEYVMSNIPDYQQAQTRLAKYTADWQKELEAKYQEVDNLRKSYQQEAYLLPENLKQRRQNELKTKEQEVRDLQRQRFAAGGDLDKKREELIKPIQDRVYTTIERIAREKNYAFIFDKSGSPTLVYASEKYDISDQVLEMMGITPGAGNGPVKGVDAGGIKSPEGGSMGDKPKGKGLNNPEINRK